jgi:diguanylate cyclase (GGDEF)-like protein
MEVKANNYEHAIEIAPRIWWVGYVLPDDPFQCHVYLIENEDESILIDPGSKLTWEVTRKKILEVIPLENIKYIICHHQDPDITSCIEDLLAEIGTQNRYLITHWRTAALLKHYGWGIEFYEVDKNGWFLKTKEREIEFIFTPYMHFAGNICSYDKESKILFSSDIFGAFTESFQLFAEDAQKYFEQMKAFHTHYMPSKEIVNHGLDKIAEKDPQLIAPQHGSIISKEMISYLITKLRKLDVGIYLYFDGSRNVQRLTKANEILSKIFEQIPFTSTSMYEKIDTIMMLIKELFALERVICLSSIDGKVILFDTFTVFPKETALKEKEFFDLIEKILREEGKTYYLDKIKTIDLQEQYLAYPFITYDEHHSINGVCYFLFSKDDLIDKEDKEILNNFKKVFSIMLSKEIGYYRTQKERNELFNKVITDELVGVYNRYYLEDVLPKEFKKAQRHHYPLCIAMLDIDNFKQINDTYGHDVGDMVLRHFARTLQSNLRESDFLFRYGGEEFLILMPFTKKEDAKKVLERIRNTLKEDKEVKIANKYVQYTFSAGISQFYNEKSVSELVKKADELLYKAKRNGKDKIEVE